jgi:two-component system response regulator CpxR
VATQGRIASRDGRAGSFVADIQMSEQPSVSHATEGGPSILLVDDDAELCALMSEYFAGKGYRVDVAPDGRVGLRLALQGSYELVILDVTIPTLGGLEVLRHLRQRSDVPVIMLTARTSERDRIAGLESGADDYLPKPFDPGELLARVRAVLRRTGHLSPVRRTPVQIGGIQLNPGTRQVHQNGRPIALTSIEFDILDVLMRSAGRIVSRDEMATILYQREITPYERSVDVHVSHLRKKLESAGHPLIRTVRGVGYMFLTE